MTSPLSGVRRRLLRRQSIVAAFSLTISAVSLAVLAGWIWNIDALKRVFPGLVSMNPATALAFLPIAASLWLIEFGGLQRGRWRQLPQMLALIAGAVGLWKIASLVWPALPGVDALLFSDRLAGDVGDVPNRMAPNTAMCLFLLGMALVTLDQRPAWCSQVLTIVVALISLVALIGYSYQVSWLYGVGNLIPMAVHTALLFQIGALTTLLVRPGRGLMDVVTGTTTTAVLGRTLLPCMVVIVWLFGFLRLEGERQGWYASDVGVALYTVTVIALLSLLIWRGLTTMDRAEVAKRKSTAERERFFTLSLDMLCIAGTDGFFKRLNPAFHETLGYRLDELLAQPIMGLIHEDDHGQTQRQLARLARGESVRHFEARFRCRDGLWKWLSWKAQGFPGEGLIYATARDVTGQKEAEKAIQQLNTDLSARAAQLETANQELESFSYSVSHDLRAPLRHIQGYVQMLTRSVGAQLTEKPQRYLETISSASVEMGVLIDDLLSFSRMGRTELHDESVDLGALVQDLVPEIQSSEGQQIEWHIGELPRVAGDRAMLKQAFANLLGNAVKYSRNRKPSVIEVGQIGADASRSVIRVRDNGAGFDMRYAHKLFGVFQRLHRPDEFEGTGIGLAIVRRIISRHGGRVWAESQIDRGATFFLTLAPVTRPTSLALA